MFPVHPLSAPWKHQKTETSGNSKILWCFQEVETGCIGNKWIKTKLNIKWVDLSTTSPVDTKRKLNVLCTFNLCPVSTGSVLKNYIQRYENSFFLLISNSRSSHPEVFLIKDVLKKCSKFTGEHGCSPVNLLHIFKTPFPRDTSGWLLLQQLLTCKCWNLFGTYQHFIGKEKLIWRFITFLNENAELKISRCLCLHTKIISRRFCIIIAFIIWVMRTRDIWNVFLQT